MMRPGGPRLLALLALVAHLVAHGEGQEVVVRTGEQFVQVSCSDFCGPIFREACPPAWPPGACMAVPATAMHHACNVRATCGPAWTRVLQALLDFGRSPPRGASGSVVQCAAPTISLGQQTSWPVPADPSTFTGGGMVVSPAPSQPYTILDTSMRFGIAPVTSTAGVVWKVRRGAQGHARLRNSGVVHPTPAQLRTAACVRQAARMRAWRCLWCGQWHPHGRRVGGATVRRGHTAVWLCAANAPAHRPVHAEHGHHQHVQHLHHVECGCAAVCPSLQPHLHPPA